MAVLRLIRFPNLLIVAITQAILYHHLLLPNFREFGIHPSLSPQLFSIFILVTVLLTAGGYVINDLLDSDADLINKPQKVIIDKSISRQSGVWLYFCSNLMGFFLALYLAFRVNYVALVNIFPLATAGLFLYSYIFKRRPLVGNFLISFYCAGVAGIIWFAEREGFADLLRIAPEVGKKIQLIFITYLFFAFLSTLLRELTKDMEDFDGDAQVGYQTAPIAWGMEVTRKLALGCALSLFIMLLFFAYQFYQQLVQPWSLAVLFLILVPLVVAMIQLYKAQNKQNYHQVSQLVKWIMFSGLLLLLFL
ncbi:MAG: prenyltransferase [Saprospiraceae bacterium]|nr:MAG: prenyltransferase [Saprospiraceae bacterium]